MKIALFPLLCCFSVSLLSAQPVIEWQKSLGGSSFEEAYSIQQTNDNGYVLAGYTRSNDGDVTGNHGIYDFWVVKLTNLGSIQWQKTLGGSSLDWPSSIQQTTDGGYIVAGFTESNDGDVSGNHGDKDVWIVKLNSTGVVEWQKTLGGSGWDEGRCVTQTTDDGYIIAGTSGSNDGDVTGNHGGSLDFWIVKLDNAGTIQWQKSLGGSDEDVAHSIQQTIDGGYIIAGEAASNDGDVIENNGNVDFWVVKLNNMGDLEWQKTLGGLGADIASDIHETNDGFLVCGYSGSNDGDVMGHHGLFDFWIIKLDITGEIEWQKTLGGSDADWGYASTPSGDGGYFVGGTTRSTDGDVLNNDGGQDIWLVKLSNVGELVWQKTIGGSQAENGLSIWQTNDDGLIVTGKSSSNDGDVIGNHGGQDFWVVKLSPESVGVNNLPDTQAGSLEIYPNPAWQSLSLKIMSQELTLNITISDVLGRAMLQQNIPNDGQVDISALPAGLYHVAAKTPSGKAFPGKFRKE